MDTVATALPVEAFGAAKFEAPADKARWKIGTRIAFRFTCSYLVFVFFPGPADYATIYLSQWWPNIVNIFDPLNAMWNSMITWTGAHVFHVAVATAQNGSGDRPADWIQLFICLMLAAAATVVWSILDRKNRHDEAIYPWFRLWIRLLLAMIVLFYGAAKVFPSQFPPMSLARFMEPTAAGSPMGLLWTAMSASRIYSFFAGSVEVLAAILLFVPRFATLGGLVAVGAMANVFALNMSYDVPVKQYSFHLMLMGLLVAGPDLANLAKLFLFNRPFQLFTAPPLLRSNKLNRAGLIAQIAMGLFFVPIALIQGHADAAQYAANPPYYGLWKVDDFRLNGVLRPPLMTDPARWRQIAFDHYSRFYIQPMDKDVPARYLMTIDAKGSHLSLKGKTESGKFTIKQLASDRIAIDGTMQGKRIDATLHEVPLSSFLLVNRGFHWVNEVPYNR